MPQWAIQTLSDKKLARSCRASFLDELYDLVPSLSTENTFFVLKEIHSFEKWMIDTQFYVMPYSQMAHSA